MKLKLFFIIFLVAALLAACAPSAPPAAPTPDVAAVRTSAASTVVSQFTLTAAVFTTVPPPTLPTETQAPEVTPTETSLPVAQVTNAEGTTVALCDKYSWDPATVDVNVPDNTTMSPGQEFVKTWKIKNVGSCKWGEGYTMLYSYGDDKMSGQPQPLAAVIEPGQEVDVSVNFKAPNLPGTYTSYWTLQNPKGIAFQGNDGKVVYVQIVVQ